MAPLLVNVLSVGPLASGASITLPHGLNYNAQGVIPTQVICDRCSPIAVTATSTTSVTFTNGGGVPASANFRAEYDHSIHAVGATPVAWQGFVTSGTGQTVYGSFSDDTDQTVPAGVATPIQFSTVETSNGVSLTTNGLGQNTRLTVSTNGVYKFDLSLQLFHSGGGTETIVFWASVNGTNVTNSASSIEMGNNNNRTLPFISLIVPMNAGQYLEWYIDTSAGTGLTLEHYAAVVGPPAIPAIPSVIANVTRISDL